ARRDNYTTSLHDALPILISAAVLNDQLRAASADEQISYRIKAGVPVPLVEAALMDEDGQFLAHDGEQQGELVLRAPWLTGSYIGDRKRTRLNSSHVSISY